ncbi:MAG: hypothetical protein ACRC1P_11710 [Cellulosilyticaceae bacterium]
MYLNTLICLEENVGGYGKNQRKPSGHVTISTPGIIKCYVQDLIGLTDKKYVLYVVSKKNSKAIRIGELNDPCQNKQSTWKVAIENIEGSGIDGKDLDAAAVVVEGDVIGSTDNVLVGYCKDKYLITSMLEQALPKKTKPQPTPAAPIVKVDVQTAKAKVTTPAKPVEVPKAVEPAKPVEVPKAVEPAKPVEVPKVVEPAKPVEVPTAVEPAKPVEVPKTMEPPKVVVPIEIKSETKTVTEVKPAPPQFDTAKMEEEDGEYIEQVDLGGVEKNKEAKPVIFYTNEDKSKSIEDDPIMQKVKEALIAQIKEQMQSKDGNKEMQKEVAKEQSKETQKEVAKEQSKETQKEVAKEQSKEMQKEAAKEHAKEQQKEAKKEQKDKRSVYDEIGQQEDKLLEPSSEEAKFLDEISQRLKRMQSSVIATDTPPAEPERFKEIKEIFERSEAIEVFDQEEDTVDWVRISMDELTAIPQLDYEWCTQPMIIFCYHKFSHFILGKDKDMEAYYVGIPDIYHTTRRYILTYDRIERFKTSTGNPISNGEYGYWIARIE